MKRNIGKKIKVNIRKLKEDLMILQRQVRGRSVYARAYPNNEKVYSKHKKRIYLELERGIL